MTTEKGNGLTQSNRKTRRYARLFGGLMASVLAIGLMPGLANAADAPPRTVEQACPPGTAPDEFVDDENSTFEDEINCIAAYEVTRGTTATTFSPGRLTSRGQMASFLMRKLDLVNGYSRPANSPDAFPDDDDTVHEPNINDAAEEGIALGFPDGTFRPGNPVTRGQMASFIVRQLEVAGADIPANPDDAFPDDDGVEPHEDNLNILHELGIYVGRTDGTSGWNEPILREQMAALLARDIAYLVEQGLVDPLSDGAGNQTFDANVAPGETQVQTNSATTGVRAATYTFTGLDDTQEYDIALFPVNWGSGYEDSVWMNGNQVTFRDQDSGFDHRADDECDTSDGWAEIVSVNGDPVSSDCTEAFPEDGVLEIRVSNVTPFEADSAWLVVWHEAQTGTGDNDELNLNADDTPSEPFGAVGPIVWTNGECATGTDIEEETVFVHPTENWAVGDNEDCTFIWDNADEFWYDGDAGIYNISAAEFRAWVNSGDYVADESDDDDPTYTRTGQNLWLLDDDVPWTPSDVTAAQGDFDTNPADTSANDVRLTWNHDPELANMDEDAGGEAGYCVDRWTVSGTGAYTYSAHIECYTWDDNSATSDAVITNRTVVVPDQPAGQAYAYTVYAVSASNYSGDYSDPSNAVTAPAASPTNVAGAPISTSATSQDADSSASLTAGDVLSVTFNELMAAPNAGDTIQVTDGDGTVANITFGLNSTWELVDGNRIVITMTAGPSITTAGTTLGVQYPADATGSSGVTDADEDNEWNIAGSTDKTF